MNTLHAHVSTRSVDCDGPIHRDYVIGYNDDEVAEHEAAIARGGWNDFSDIHFMKRVMTSVASPYAAHQMEVKVDDEGIEVFEQTEEGYRTASVRWCRHDCDRRASSYRDIRAEEAGY